MAFVFISHSSRDSKPALQIKNWLEHEGFDELFLDFDKHSGIQPGTNWERELYQKIELCEAVIVILTPHWLESKWCFAEFTQARALGKAIFPVIVTPIGETLIAGDIQHLNLLEDREGGLAQLLRNLAEISLNARGGFKWDRNRSPYPGLLSFEAEDGAIFFGRDDEIRRIIERMNARRTQGGAHIVVVLGASGTGKSSLMRAGIIPRLERQSRHWINLPTFRPGRQPFSEFSQAVATSLGQQQDWRTWAERFSDDRNLIDELYNFARDLRLKKSANEAYIVIPVDQMEELFTSASNKERKKFFNILNAIQTAEMPFLILMTMRSDYLGILQAETALEARFEEFLLPPMPLARISQIIEGPAKVAGLKIEESTVRQAQLDADTEDALPLLAFTLRELYERSAKDGMITIRDYKSLGNPTLGLTPLENAVSTVADEVWEAHTPDSDEANTLRRAFIPQLVRVNDEGEYVRRKADWDALPTQSHRLLEALAASRLLIISEVAGKRVIEVAHEALLRKWPRIKAWLDEEREFLLGKAQLERDLAEWKAAPVSLKRGALLHGNKLVRARLWMTDNAGQLTQQEHAFIAASIDEEDRETLRKARMRRRLIATIFAVLILSGITAYLFKETRDAQANAKLEQTRSESASLAVEAQHLMNEKNFLDATLRAHAAFEKLSTTQSRSTLLQSLVYTSPLLKQHISIAGASPTAVRWMPDGQAVVLGTLDGRLLRMRPVDGKTIYKETTITLPTREIEQGTSNASRMVLELARAPLGDIAALQAGGVYSHHSNTAIELEATTMLIGTNISAATLSADTTTVVYGSVNDGIVRYAKCGLEGYVCQEGNITRAYISAAALSPDGRTVALGLDGGGLQITNVGNLSSPIDVDLAVYLEGKSPRVVSLAWHPVKSRVAVGTADGNVFIVTQSGKVQVHIEDQRASVSAIAWHPTGDTLSSVCGPNWICGFDLTAALASEESEGPNTGLYPNFIARGHANTITDMAWSNDGKELASVANDHSLKIWDVARIDKVSAVLQTHEMNSLYEVELSPDGKLLASGNEAGSIFIWEAETGKLRTTLTGYHNGRVRSIAWHPDGRRLAGSDSRGRLAIWDISSPNLPIMHHNIKEEQIVWKVRWTPNARSVLLALDDGTLGLWTLPSGIKTEEDRVKKSGINYGESMIGLAVHNSSGRILSGDSNGNLFTWALEPTITRMLLPPPPSLETVKRTRGSIDISADGRLAAAAGNDGNIVLYDLTTDASLKVFPTGSEQSMARSVDDVEFSPDQRFLASVGSDGWLRVWDVKRLLPHLSVRLYETGDDYAHLQELTWLKNSTTIAVTSSHGEVRLISIDEEKWRQRVRSIFGKS